MFLLPLGVTTHHFKDIAAFRALELINRHGAILLEPRTVRSPTKPLYSSLGDCSVGASARTNANTPSTPLTIGRTPPTAAFRWIAVRPTLPAATSPASPSVAVRAPPRAPRATRTAAPPRSRAQATSPTTEPAARPGAS